MVSFYCMHKEICTVNFQCKKTNTKVLFFNTTTFEDKISLQVRLSDIEILGAIGDSDTAAFAARSTGIHTYFTGELGDAEDVKNCEDGVVGVDVKNCEDDEEW